MAETRTVMVDPSNAEALAAWDGDDGAYWTQHEALFDDALARYHHRFLDAAAITGGERVLDIGCGTGQTTRDAALLAAPGLTLGVDLSSAMIARARQRAAEQRVTNARFEQADAQIHPFDPQGFDVAISRTGAMFFGDPAAAFANIAQALRPGGRLALLVWQPEAENEWAIELDQALAAGRVLPEPPLDAPGPFSLADPDRTRTILSRAGFSAITFDGVRDLLYFGTDAEDAYRFVRGMGFTQYLLRDLDHHPRARALEALRATIVAHDTAQGVLYPSAAWIIRAHRA